MCQKTKIGFENNIIVLYFLYYPAKGKGVKRMDYKIGNITHYFDKISVAVLELSDTLTVGEKIKIDNHGEEFTMTVESMQIEHEEIQEAKKGQSVGMKVTQPVKPGAQVYRVMA